jgi:hypothetical protein
LGLKNGVEVRPPGGARIILVFVIAFLPVVSISLLAFPWPSRIVTKCPQISLHEDLIYVKFNLMLQIA